MNVTKEKVIPVYLFGSPCKINIDDDIIYGRYIGDSDIPILNDKIILICTPCNSIRHVMQSKVNFELIDDDLLLLKEFEDDAISHGEWYHKNTDINKLNTSIHIFADDIPPLLLINEL